MSAEKNNVSETVNSLFKGMEGFISSKTVVGDPMTIGDTTIIPLVDVSFGIGAGAFSGEKTGNGGGGMGGKVTPNCILVIQGSDIRLVNIKNQDAVSKIMDLLPEIVRKLKKKTGKDIIEDIPADVFESTIARGGEKASEEEE